MNAVDNLDLRAGSQDMPSVEVALTRIRHFWTITSYKAEPIA